ncbi:DUF1827 family protein [Latilactobacillus graminis]|nr:DUF1827 family protein [Latilactobacillus graminis]QFP79190.1 DUF1827 family protein [Latilactobacillus graminis]
MRLINVTNSYNRLVSQQLATTAATYVKVYSLGKTTVLDSHSAKDRELLLKNDHRHVQQAEIDFVLKELAGLDSTDGLEVLNDGPLVEITLPTPSTTAS